MLSRRRLSLAGALVVLCAAGAAWWAATVEPAPPPDASERLSAPAVDAPPPAPQPALAGYVVDLETRQGVPGAEALVACGDGAPVRARADAEGAFAFDALPAARCRLWAQAPGFVAGGPDPDGARTLDLTGGEPVDDLELGLFEEASVQGHVMAHGEPVEGATLTVLYLESPVADGAYTATAEGTSDAAGAFHIEHMGPGRIQLLAEHDDYAMAESEALYLAPGDHLRDVDIDMSRGGSVVGLVVDDEGRPVADARVELVAPGRKRPREASVDEGGAFSFEGVAPGEATVTARAMGFRRARQVVHVGAGDEVEARLVLRPREGFGGRVVGPDGEPVARAAVMAWPDGPPAGAGAAGDAPRPAAFTDSQGRFWLGWVPNERTRVWASHPAYAPSPRESPLSAEGELVLTLRPGGRLRGRVVERGGRPVPFFRVFAVGPGNGARPLDVGDGGGAFEFEGLTPGRYAVYVRADGYPPVSTHGHVVRAGQVTDTGDIVLDPGGGLVGTVVDRDTGEPLAGALVMMSGARAAGYRGMGPRARTGRDGRFRLTGLPAGRLSLQVRRAGYVMRVVSALAAEPGGEADAGEIPLRRALGGRDARRMEYSGIGAVLAVRGGHIYVGKTFQGAPAAEMGLSHGAEILRVDGVDVSTLGLRRTVELIRGEEGSDVTLEIIPPGGTHPEEVRVTRGEVVTP